MEINTIYQDQEVMVVDKPAGIVVFPEGTVTQKTLIDYLIDKNPELREVGQSPRYGVVHRLDKDTSGVLLVAKTDEALIFFQKQFKSRGVEKKYIALVNGSVKEDSATIHTYMGRSPADPRKQKVFLLDQPEKTGLRQAITAYRVLERFEQYTLLEVQIQTGRKHQIRCHMAYIHHPIAGDKLYGFKDSRVPNGLKRQFLHASFLKIGMMDGSVKEFVSPLPQDLKSILQTL